LVLKPHFALRIGDTRLSPQRWKIKPRVTKELIAQPRQLADTDFDLDLSQKGVDMRIGLDMARLALRETVRTVVVVTGDSDFVAAFKFARREGVKIILAYERRGRSSIRAQMASSDATSSVDRSRSYTPAALAGRHLPSL
jgi:uncharacterized LabA/DUF88 family protein